MKIQAPTAMTLMVVAVLILTACVPVPPPAAPAAGAPVSAATATAPPTPVVAPNVTESPTAGPMAPAGEWQTYTDAQVGFSIQYPGAWSEQSLPNQNNGAIHGTAFTGSEGGLEVYWGVGFGGACPTGTVQVQLADCQLPACYAKDPDGTEIWSQIGYEVRGGNSFSVLAYTSDAQPSSHDLVLQVLSTLMLMPPTQPQTAAAVPNPASQDCVDQGGTLISEERGDGGQFGVCTFEDNVQCEEWALLLGDCPAGGVKMTGYVTPAARYCAITGGEYAITGNDGAEDEQGTCTLPDGTECDAWYYYDHHMCNDPQTEVITYVPGLPTGEPEQGNCWTNSLAVWRDDAWRCTIGNAIYDPCFSTDEGVICGANPNAPTTSFLLLLTEPLPAPEVPQDMTRHAWQVELADGTVCEYATGATGGVGNERINYFCPSPDPNQPVVILGDLQPGYIWMAKRAVLTGGPPDPTVLESAEVPVRTVWR